MKIYFCGSIRGGRKHQETYWHLINYLKKYGRVLTEHVGDPKLSGDGEPISKAEIYERDMVWLKETDVVIAEVSSPSLGVGYELGSAEHLGKKVLCLYKKGSEFTLSAMIEGDKYFLIKTYDTLEEAYKHIDAFLGKI